LDGTDPWGKYREYPNGWLCEFSRTFNLMRERSNTFSNMAYILAGIVIMAHGIYNISINRFDPTLNADYPIRTSPFISMYFGFGCFILGFGSWVNHGTHTYFGWWCDEWTMGSIICQPLVFQLWLIVDAVWKRWCTHAAAIHGVHAAAMNNRPYVVSYWWFVGLHALFALLLGIYQRDLMANPDTATILLVAIVVIAGFLAICFYIPNRQTLQLRWLVAGIVSVAVGFALWNLDKQRIWCQPNSVLQPHGFWHGFTALGLYCIYHYLQDFHCTPALQHSHSALARADPDERNRHGLSTAVDVHPSSVELRSESKV